VAGLLGGQVLGWPDECVVGWLCGGVAGWFGQVVEWLGGLAKCLGRQVDEGLI